MNTFKDLYSFLQLLQDTSILKFLKDSWNGKDKQESLFRLFAILKIIPDFSQSYRVCDGNFNKGTIFVNDDIEGFLSHSLKDKGDKSDLTLINENTKTIIVCSSKNFQSTNFGIGDLDIRDILSLYQRNYSKNNYVLRLCVVVKDKDVLRQKINNAERCNTDLKDILTDKNTLIFDWNDIDSWYKIFKANFEHVPVKDLNNLLCVYKRIPLSLRLHQEYAVLKTIELFMQKFKNILWGHIPRSGKSYIMAGLISKTLGNILIITTCPNETITEYFNVFNKYLQFCDYNIIKLDGKFESETQKLTGQNIIIVSKQFLQSKGVLEKNYDKTISWLKDMKFELRFVDESHNGGSTELMEKTMLMYGKNCNTVFMTATYMKPLMTYSIPKECWILWDLEDVNLCKNVSSKNLKHFKERMTQKHGTNFSTYIDKFGVKAINETYNIFPELHFITNAFRPDVKKEIVRCLEHDENNSGWSLESLFLLKQNGQKTIPQFQNEDDMKKFCEQLFGKVNAHNTIGFSIKDYNSVMSRIEKIATDPFIQSRTFTPSEPLSIVCFLPYGQKTPVSTTKMAFMKFLEKHTFLQDFDIVALSTSSSENTSEQVSNAYNKAKMGGKKGVLYLTGKQCEMGITIPHCDVVLLLNQTESLDSLYQMMFRCMSENANKKCGFVVDMNNQRVARVLVDYSMKVSPLKDVKKALKHLFESRLVHLNHDDWGTRYFDNHNKNVPDLINSIHNVWCMTPKNNIKRILDEMYMDSATMSKEDRLNLQKIFKKTSFSNKTPGGGSTEQTTEMDGPDSDICDGIEMITLPDQPPTNPPETPPVSPTSPPSTQSSPQKDPPPTVDLVRDIIKFIIPIGVILTCKEDGYGMTHMLQTIEKNHKYKNIFINQVKIWWGDQIPDSIIETLIGMNEKYLVKNTNIDHVVSRVKELFKESLHNQRQLASLVDEYLLPQEFEKKKNAEVSTPASLRKDMLDALERYAPDFFKGPKTVFEPCCGKGQFVLDIVDRFMIGLKDLVPDEKERYKLIVEKCVFMADINPTNVYITKLLLDPEDKYDINIFEGDTLKVDVKEEWGIDKFDAVIGNPPYNEGFKDLSKGSIKPLYNVFIERFVDLCDTLLFVVPSRWFAGGKNLDNFRNMMMNRNDIVFIEHIDQKFADKLFGNGVEIKGGVNYFMINSNYNGDCSFNGISYKLNKYDIIIHPRLHDVIDKIQKNIRKNKLDTLDTICKSGSYSRIQTNDKRLSKEKLDDTFVKCYVSKCKGFEKYIKAENVDTELLNSWKVITSRAYNCGNNFGKMHLLCPNEIFTSSYISFIVKNETEGQNLIKLLNTKLMKFMLHTRKISQDIKPRTCQWVPLLDLNQEYDDEKIYTLFQIDQGERTLIESIITK